MKNTEEYYTEEITENGRIKVLWDDQILPSGRFHPSVQKTPSKAV